MKRPHVDGSHGWCDAIARWSLVKIWYVISVLTAALMCFITAVILFALQLTTHV